MNSKSLRNKPILNDLNSKGLFKRKASNTQQEINRLKNKCNQLANENALNTQRANTLQNKLQQLNKVCDNLDSNDAKYIQKLIKEALESTV